MANVLAASRKEPVAQAEILVVEDDQWTLDLIHSVLRDAGYGVMSANNADIALIMLEQGLPFQVLITDIAMPGLLDGYGLARKARVFRPDIQIIYTTGYAGVATVRSRGAPYGPTLVKPWRSDALLETIRSIHRVPA